MRTKTWTPEPWDGPLKPVTTADDSAGTKEGPGNVASARQATQPPGPDSGLSWFIAVLCFLVNLLFSSFLRCGGLFFTSIMSTYGATRGYASLPLSMYSGFVNLSGLLAGPLIHWFGVRVAAVLGGLMMAMGCMSSYFATGIPFLVGSLGVLAGSGHGLLFSCVIVAINEYFDKRRGVALGINLTGATAASFVFANVFDRLLSEYGLHGTLAITGAILLNIAALGFLFRKPPWQESTGEAHTAVEESAQKYSSDLVTCSFKGKKVDDEKLSSVLATHKVALRRSGTLVIASGKEHVDQSRPSLSVQADCFERENHTVESVLDDTTGEDEINLAWSRRGTLLSVAGPLLEEEKTLCSSRRDTVISQTRKGSVVGDLDVKKIALLQEVTDRLTNVNATGAAFEENASFLLSEHATGTRSRTTSEPNFMERNGCGNRAGNSRRSTVTNLGSRCHIELPSKPDEPIRIVLREEEGRSSDSALDSAKEVLRLPRFYCHMLSYFSYSFLLDTFLAVAVDFAVDVGIPSSSAVFVLTFFSVTDTVGRLFVPLLTDYKIVSPLSLMCVAYLAMAAMALSMPYAKHVVSFWATMVTLGLPAGYILVAISEVIALEVGIGNLPIAFGFVSGLTAVGAFLRPVIIGFFRDSYGSYDGLFQLMGGMVLCSFLLTAGLWVLDRRGTPTPAAEKCADSNSIVGDIGSPPPLDGNMEEIVITQK